MIAVNQKRIEKSNDNSGEVNITNDMLAEVRNEIDYRPDVISRVTKEANIEHYINEYNY